MKTNSHLSLTNPIVLAVKLLALTASWVILSMVFGSAKAQACGLSLHPDPGSIPISGVRDYLECADEHTQTPSYRQWVASGSDASKTDITISQGIDRVGLGWRNIGTDGWKHDNPPPGAVASNGWAVDNHAQVQSVSASGPTTATVTGVAPAQRLDLNGFNDDPGFTAQGVIGFDLNSPGGFKTGDYIVTFSVKEINHFHKVNGTESYQCVGGSESQTTADDFSKCDLIDVSMSIHVTVGAKVQAHVFKVNSAGDNLGDVDGATLDTCSSPASISTGSDGMAYLDTTDGAGFCLRITGGGPSSVQWDGPYVRPWGEGYGSCGGYGGPPYSGYCSNTWTTYECQVAGGPYSSCGSDRSSDGGYDFVYVQKPPVTITAHVFKVDATGDKIGDVDGATIDTCNGDITTGSNGFATKDLLPGTGFCLDITGGGPGGSFTGPYVRPWSESYNGCGGYGGGPTNFSGHCGGSRYECQVAGGYFNPDSCNSNIDRTADDGYDFVYVDQSPNLACGNVVALVGSSPGDPESGESFDIRVSFRNDSGGAPITNATYPLTVTLPTGINPSGTSTVPYSPDPLNSGDTATNNPGTLASLSAPPGQYTIKWRVSGAYGTINCQGSVSVASKPYFRVYGGDVYAGGDFDSGSGVCTNDSQIIGWYKENGTTSGQGAGTQLVGLALDSVDNFVSAMLRDPAGANPRQKKGLTLANTGSGVDPTWGGNYNSGGSHCLFDYFKDHPTAVSTGSNLVINPASDETRYYEPAGGTLTLSAGPVALNNGKHLTLYVKGNVYIRKGVGSLGIAYNTAGWTTTNDIPSFILVVLGNIYIDPDVEQLDGFYIAQSNPAVAPDTTGRIYTCANSTGPIAPGSLFDSCGKQLTINGAFAAYRVKLLRTTSSLRYGLNGEYPGWAAPRDCLGSTHDICAGEVFKFSPELYITPNPGLDPIGGGSGDWEYMISLPPVL